MTKNDKTHQIEKLLSRILRRLRQKGITYSTTFEKIRPTGFTITTKEDPKLSPQYTQYPQQPALSSSSRRTSTIHPPKGEVCSEKTEKVLLPINPLSAPSPTEGNNHQPTVVKRRPKASLSEAISCMPYIKILGNLEPLVPAAHEEPS